MLKTLDNLFKIKGNIEVGGVWQHRVRGRFAVEVIEVDPLIKFRYANCEINVFGELTEDDFRVYYSQPDY